jgi:putative ABC transport system substrate-binding protein
MNKKIVVPLVATVILVSVHLAGAQQPKKIPRIGLLFTGESSPPSPNVEAFRQGLRDLSYVEGKNIVLEYRYAEGKIERLTQLAEELVRLPVDVIVTALSPAIHAAKRATDTIPIVFAVSGNPMATGYVASLARPGGNVTGLSALGPELSGKQLELLKEAIPKASRMAVLTNPSGLNWKLDVKEMEPAARSLGVQLQVLEIRGPDDLDRAFQSAKRQRAEAVLLPLFRHTLP